jgi:TonB family protein
MVGVNKIIDWKAAAAVSIALAALAFSEGCGGAVSAEGKPWDTVSLDVEYDEPPVVIKAVRPVYPEEASEAKIEGDVTLLVYIDENGDVRNAIVRASPGYAPLEEAAKEAALKCKFKPAKYRGKPVGVWYDVVMEFRLPSDE